MASYSSITPPPTLPVCPASWFYLCRSKDLTQRPKSFNPLGKGLVGFRTKAGDPVLMDSRCSHFGANLCHGRVEGNHIRCAFHGWKYAANGECVEMPYPEKIPAFARQQSFPMAERNGQVFFFNGKTALFPLPFFEGENPDDFITSKPIAFESQTVWYVVAANSWDIIHFEKFHYRKALREPVMGPLSTFSYHVDCTHEIIGPTVLDRVLRTFLAKTVHVTVVVWAGNMILLRARFAKWENHFIFSVRPDGTDSETLKADLLLYVRKSESALKNLFTRVVSLPIRRVLTDAFFRKESRSLDGLRYTSASGLVGDKPVLDFLDWLSKVPQSVSTKTTLQPRDEKPCFLNS